MTWLDGEDGINEQEWERRMTRYRRHDPRPDRYNVSQREVDARTQADREYEEAELRTEAEQDAARRGPKPTDEDYVQRVIGAGGNPANLNDPDW